MCCFTIRITKEQDTVIVIRACSASLILKTHCTTNAKELDLTSRCTESTVGKNTMAKYFELKVTIQKVQ